MSTYDLSHKYWYALNVICVECQLKLRYFLKRLSQCHKGTGLHMCRIRSTNSWNLSAYISTAVLDTYEKFQLSKFSSSIYHNVPFFSNAYHFVAGHRWGLGRNVHSKTMFPLGNSNRLNVALGEKMHLVKYNF